MGLSLDIGCGAHKHPGALGVDPRSLPGVAVVCDFEQGLPFRDGSVTTVFLHNIVEHMDDLVTFMEELYRICEPGRRSMCEPPTMPLARPLLTRHMCAISLKPRLSTSITRTIMGSKQTLKFAPRTSRCENHLSSCRAISRNGSVATYGMPV